MKVLLATALIMIGLTSFAAGGATNLFSELSPLSSTSTNPVSPAALVPGAGPGSYTPDDKYKLRIGDKLSFQILEDRDGPRMLVVADSGELDVPYLGRVAAVDKTCQQLAKELKTELERDYYYRASVVVALESANRTLGRVYVWGQVRNQGPVELVTDETLTAGKAVLRAGGFGDFANKKRVKVVRPASGNNAKQVFELNMVEILEQGQTEKDLALKPDDSVIVSSRLINF
jgi:protein involved in polysaccharide export with SLBB domain